ERGVAMALPLTGRDHPVAHDRGGLAGGRTEQLVLGQTWDRETQVDPVEQRTRELVPVPIGLIGPAPAVFARITREAAWTGVGRGDQREPRRERDRAAGPGDDDRTVLERLAEGLDGVAAELRELIQEQHPAVGEAGLARTQDGRAAAEES